MMLVGLLTGCGRLHPPGAQGWCGVHTRAEGPQVEDSRDGWGNYLILLDDGVGVFLESYLQYRYDPDGIDAATSECPSCFTWEKHTYELRWRPTDAGFDIKSPGPDGGVTDWTCTLLHEGRRWEAGGEWVDCDLVAPDGSERHLALSSNAHGQIVPLEQQTWPCMGLEYTPAPE